eukprot:1761083-Rhodomonas_salina.1
MEHKCASSRTSSVTSRSSPPTVSAWPCPTRMSGRSVCVRQRRAHSRLTRQPLVKETTSSEFRSVASRCPHHPSFFFGRGR